MLRDPKNVGFSIEYNLFVTTIQRKEIEGLRIDKNCCASACRFFFEHIYCTVSGRHAQVDRVRARSNQFNDDCGCDQEHENTNKPTNHHRSSATSVASYQSTMKITSVATS